MDGINNTNVPVDTGDNLLDAFIILNLPQPINRINQMFPSISCGWWWELDRLVGHVKARVISEGLLEFGQDLWAVQVFGFLPCVVHLRVAYPLDPILRNTLL